MTMTSKYLNHPVGSFGGGMNTLRDPNDIDDNQFTYLQNFSMEGNKLQTMKGNQRLIDSLFQTARVQGIGSYGNTIFYIDGNALKNFEIVDGVLDKTKLATAAMVTGSNATRYNITTFYLGDIYVVITDMDGVEDFQVKRFHYSGANWVYAAHTVAGVTNKKFTCSTFYQQKLIFGGNPIFPGNIIFSKTANAATAIATPDAWIDFSAYNGGSQIIDSQFGLVGFATRQDVLYMVSTGNVWKSSSVLDDGTSFQFIVSNETHTGAVNQYAICTVDQDVFYFDGRSVRRLSFETNTLALKDASISEPIQSFIDAQASNKSRAVCMFSYPNFYVVMPSNDSAINNVAGVYNVINKSWGTAAGIYATYTTSYNDRKARACFGSAVTSGVTIANETYALDGLSAGIVGIAASKVFTMLNDVDFKRYVQIEFHGNISNGLTVEIDLLINGKVVQTREIVGSNIYLSTTGTVTAGTAQSGGMGEEVSPYLDYFEKFEMFNDGRSYQFVVRQSGVGRFEINFMNIKYKPVKAYPIHH